MNDAPTAAAASIGEPGVRRDVDAVADAGVGDAGPDQLHPLVDREQPAGLLVVVHHGDGDVTEQLDGLLDDVEVPEVDRVEAAGVEHGRHGCRQRSAGAGAVSPAIAGSSGDAVQERHPRPAVALDPALLPVRRRRRPRRRPRRRRGRPARRAAAAASRRTRTAGRRTRGRRRAAARRRCRRRRSPGCGRGAPSVAMFSSIAATAPRSRSTNVQCAAPRDSASMPSAPLPA